MVTIICDRWDIRTPHVDVSTMQNPPAGREADGEVLTYVIRNLFVPGRKVGDKFQLASGRVVRVVWQVA